MRDFLKSKQWKIMQNMFYSKAAGEIVRVRQRGAL